MPLSPWLDRALCAIGLAVPTVAAVVMAASAPSFAEVFSNFDAEASRLAQFFIDYRFAPLALPLAVGALWWGWPHAKSRGVVVAVVGVVTTALLASAFMGAMYLPIFLLAQ